MLTINDDERPFGRATQAVRFLQYRIENRREVAGRVFDELKDLSRGRLLVACLAQFGG